MLMTNAADPDACRRGAYRLFAPALALLLLSVLVAVPADAQRGGGHGGGSGHHARSSGDHSGHHGGYSGARGNHGYRGDRGYRGDHGYRGYAGYRGSYRYPGYYGRYGSYLPFTPYAYYDWPGYWGFGYYGYPGISISYDASPSYLLRDDVYRHRPGYVEYAPLTGPPGDRVTESGESDAAAEPYDTRPQPARIRLSVTPGDASVYLDGAFLGLAAELPEELWVDPGAHRLEVARPGFASRQLDLTLAAGEERHLDAGLEPGR